METQTDKKARLNWTIGENSMVCKFNAEISAEFKFADIKEWDKSHMEPLVFGLFQHGLKQKLADCVAGATKNGVSFADQKKTMMDKWEDIRTGVARERKNAKIDPLAEARAKLDAMEEGPLKEQAMAMAKLIGIVK